MITFGSACSGIEAASVAWHPLGWQTAWLAEIEPFPAAVLAHHYPFTDNLGDMTTIANRILTGEVEAPDVLVSGTPCQSFSISGLRGGIADDRGQLIFNHVEILNAADTIRRADGRESAIAVWETYPAHSAQATMLSGASWQVLLGSASQSSRQGKDGQTLVLSLDHSEPQPGASWTLNTSDWPNDASVCLLSQVLETGSIPQKYFLSSAACSGILRRAEKRGKKLPEMLEKALTRQALES